ncbi:MAG: N-acetylglucosamine-6-phosphate deacetylase [Thermoleophilia bacterium]|jgi:N-acetylglucosamine-6-phosphate deacetylase
MTLVLAGTIFAGGALRAGAVGIGRDGRLARSPAGGPGCALPDGWIVAPGFVDLQVNGFGGAEIGEDPAANAAVARALTRCGVTAFCPTLVTREPAAYRRAARALARTAWPAEGARALGAHLEGPFLNPARAGAHQAEAMRMPTAAAVDELLELMAPAIVTLAPELEGGLAAVERVAGAGAVAAVGHTEADATTGRRAIAAGARLLTHAFNAMAGIDARDPSAVVAFLADRAAYVSLIGDGVHVDPAVAALIARLAPGRLVLVSDASAPAGAPAGEYRLGPRTVHHDGRTVRTSDGRLAGSGSCIDAGVRTLASAGVEREAALDAAIGAPRRLLGLPPGLAHGSAADLVVLDEDLHPRFTLVGGVPAHVDPVAARVLGPHALNHLRVEG